MRMKRSILAVAVIASTSCATMPPPFPVVGDPPQVSALSGAWNGEYSSRVTGRHGAINFSLAAGADTAFGDVLMLPSVPRRSRAMGETTTPARGEIPAAISIGFVLAAHDSVYGIMDPYPDPDSGSPLVTRFAGRRRGDRIEGRYLTQDQRTGEVTSGEWNVRRVADRGPR